MGRGWVISTPGEFDDEFGFDENALLEFGTDGHAHGGAVGEVGLVDVVDGGDVAVDVGEVEADGGDGFFAGVGEGEDFVELAEGFGHFGGGAALEGGVGAVGDGDDDGFEGAAGGDDGIADGEGG